MIVEDLQSRFSGIVRAFCLSVH